MRDMPLRRVSPTRGIRRHMHESRKPQIGTLVHRLDRAPAQIVAEITSGVAGRPCIDAGGKRGAQQFCGVRPERRCRRALDDRSLACAMAIGIGDQRRHRVAGAGLDSHMSRAVGKPEHQQRLRADFCDQLWQLAVDRIVGDVKDMARQFDVVERRTTELCQPLHQGHGRIVGRARKRAEAGDENGEFFAQSFRTLCCHARAGGHPVFTGSDVIPSRRPGILDRPPSRTMTA